MALMLASSVAVSVVLGQATETDNDSVSAPAYDDLALSPEDFKDEDDDSGLPTKPSPGFYMYLEECSGKMKDECGAEIIGNLFTDKAVLMDTCCIELVAIGKACHLAMVNMAFSLLAFKPYASLVLPRSEQLWNKCVAVSHIAPASLYEN